MSSYSPTLTLRWAHIHQLWSCDELIFTNSDSVMSSYSPTLTLRWAHIHLLWLCDNLIFTLKLRWAHFHSEAAMSSFSHQLWRCDELIFTPTLTLRWAHFHQRRKPKPPAPLITHKEINDADAPKINKSIWSRRSSAAKCYLSFPWQKHKGLLVSLWWICERPPACHLTSQWKEQ